MADITPDQQSALAILREQAKHHALLIPVARKANLPTIVSAHRHRLGALMEARRNLKALWMRQAIDQAVVGARVERSFERAA